MDDCIIFREGLRPFITKVPRSSTQIELQNPVSGKYEKFRFHAVLKGRMTNDPQRYLYAGSGNADPYEKWDVWQQNRYLYLFADIDEFSCRMLCLISRD